ncbi:MAG: ribosome biogenesis GTPase YlqF [Clostridiales Family XIII bacterium]|nr:ribosome biogenesis GTPase YlqF [Clostridiales Family XIII bacterium]
MDNINWYPGHMKKTRELIHENLKLVDVVLELVDARIPASGRNPILDAPARGKKRLLLLNKSDLAEEAENARWLEHFRAEGTGAWLLNGVSGEGVKAMLRALSAFWDERSASGARTGPLRLMAVGVPNVGKSSLINRLAGRKSAKTGDRPGVTRGKQWIALENGMRLLDTPGILWPKFEDRDIGLKLAFCGSIRDEILDTEELARALVQTLLAVPEHAGFLAARYRLDAELVRRCAGVLSRRRAGAAPAEAEVCDGELREARAEDGAPAILEAIALNRGFLLHGRRADSERAAKTLLDEFRAGRLGRITLERAPRGNRAIRNCNDQG